MSANSRYFIYNVRTLVKEGTRMPKNTIHKEFVNKDIFIFFTNQKQSSIRKLGKLGICNERTIRRSLNEGKMTASYLNQFAKALDIDPRLLSGQLHNDYAKLQNSELKNALLATLTPERHPYFKKIQTELSKFSMNTFLAKLFSLFEISYEQFEKMEFDQQYNLQYELFNSIIPIMRKYFKQDGYGNKTMPNLEKILFDLEDFRDNYYEHLYADTILREKYMNNPPLGISKKKIQNMSSDQLISLDLDMQY